MHKALAISAGLMVAALQAKAATSDKICSYLRSFEAAPFAIGADGKPVRRSVTFIWSGPWLSPEMSWGCKHNEKDAASAKLCSYLMEHTSLEFRAMLPVRVLRCYGYSFPQSALYDWSDWKADIRLRGTAVARSLRLHVDLNSSEPAAAEVGISAIPESATGGTDPSKN